MTTAVGLLLIPAAWVLGRLLRVWLQQSDVRCIGRERDKVTKALR